MKSLVVFFSLTGNTRKVAEKIAKSLKADIDEIIDKDKVGDKAMLKDIRVNFKKDPSKYDLVVIGSPVWAFGIPPATRSYLVKNKFKKVAFFCTFGLTKAFLFWKMRKYSENPVATLSIHMKKVDQSDDEIAKFCASVGK